MPWPVYSERFISKESTGWSTYTVPSGQRAVVTCITITNFSGSANLVQVNVGGVNCVTLPLQAAQSSRFENLRLVCYQLQAMQAFIQGVGCALSLNGYLFDDVTGRSGPPEGASTLPAPPDGPWQGSGSG